FLLVCAAWVGAGLTGGELLRVSLRLRGFFLALLLVHGSLTPGDPLPLPFTFLAHEGVIAGLTQGLRLFALSALAWVLLRVTSPWRLVTALAWFGGALAGMGVPVERGMVLLARTLERLPVLFHRAGRIGEVIRLRQPGGVGMGGRWRRWVLGGEGLLLALLWDVRRVEMAIARRGGLSGLVRSGSLPRIGASLGWVEGMLLLGPLGLVAMGWSE
ncbi:MAG: hypothetical protein HQL59_10140, partial [Magnetococcales bacterium]|nr:hypothetical protein [Magnetococcales bacterium]